jgi:hypothetical protein
MSRNLLGSWWFPCNFYRDFSFIHNVKQSDYLYRSLKYIGLMNLYLVLFPVIVFSLGLDDEGADNNKRKKQIHFLILREDEC